MGKENLGHWIVHQHVIINYVYELENSKYNIGI